MLLSITGPRHIEDMSEPELRALLESELTPATDKRILGQEIQQRRKQRAATDAPKRVLIAGVGIPFVDLVGLLVKLTLAAIPALLIIGAIALAIAVALAALGGLAGVSR